MAGRRIPLSGARNFRDLGGYRGHRGREVVCGSMFRADALHRLSAQDEAVLAGLGVETVFDLRSVRELDQDGVGGFAGARGRHVHLPLVSVTLSPFDPEIDWTALDLRGRYLEMLEVGGPAIRTIFEALAAPDRGAVIFHCTGGKDRTGVVAALVLRALGVTDDDIVADYARSEHYLAELIAGYRSELERLGLDDEAVAYLTSSPPARMRHTLRELDRRWGTTTAYLGTIGVGSDVITALRDRLLED